MIVGIITLQPAVWAMQNHKQALDFYVKENQIYAGYKINGPTLPDYLCSHMKITVHVYHIPLSGSC